MLAIAWPAGLTEAAAQERRDGRWHGGVSVGAALASGNTSATTLAANADATRATAVDKITLSLLANHARSRVAGVRTTTADLLRLAGRYDHDIGERVFAFAGAETETNESGGVDARHLLDLGLGYKLVRTATTSWSVFGGVGYTMSRLTDGSDRSGAVPVLGQESSHELTEALTLKQRLTVHPDDGEVGARATFDAGLAYAIAGGWTVNAALAYRYTEDVAPGLRRNETLVTFGFGYKY